MTKRTYSFRAALGTAIAAVLTAGLGTAAPAPLFAQATAPGTYKPTRQVLLSVGEGQMVSLPRAIVDVWTSNPAVADINVTSPRQIGLFGKEAGEATIIATAADGSVVYGANVRVGQNIGSLDQMLKAAMPDANITVTHVGQIAVMNGTVQSPADSAQAEQLVRAALNPGMDTSSPNATLKIMPVNRLKTATPLQVMLQVKISEVSRTVTRDIGFNLLSADRTGGFNFAIGQGSGINTETGAAAIPGAGTALRFAGNVLGVDIISRLQLAETNGLSKTLAEPSLSAVSGETASFLAGGEFPIPIASGLNGTSIEFKEYGVSLAFTPTVLEGGRISMRVRPEVSELSSEGAIRVGGVQVPSLTTRRVETTVELGSGQSFMIGGLLRNSDSNSVDKAPFLGDLPIIGALFRSNGFKRNETELVIVVTPYLVRPVNASQIALPTDGTRTSTTVERVLLDKQESNRSGMPRPLPRLAEPRTVRPGISQQSQPAQPGAAPKRQATAQQTTPAPGFSF